MCLKASLAWWPLFALTVLGCDRGCGCVAPSAESLHSKTVLPGSVTVKAYEGKSVAMALVHRQLPPAPARGREPVGSVLLVAEAADRRGWLYGLEVRGYFRPEKEKSGFAGTCALRYLNEGRATEVDYDVLSAQIHTGAGLSMTLVCTKRFPTKLSGAIQAPHLPQEVDVVVRLPRWLSP